jgi:hypothetical protein
MRSGFEANGCASARLFALIATISGENDIRHRRQLLSKFTA